MSQLIEIKVPDIGDYKDVPVIEVLVKVGDSIQKEQSIVTLESDKATMDVPSTHSGVVKEIKVKIGDLISQGMTVILIEEADAAVVTSQTIPLAASPVTSDQPTAVIAPRTPPIAMAPPPFVAEPSNNSKNQDASHASPSVRKFARELGVAISQVSGSGPKGRITQEDVQAFVKGVMSGTNNSASPGGGTSSLGGLNLLPWPKVDFSKFGEVERIKLGSQLGHDPCRYLP